MNKLLLIPIFAPLAFAACIPIEKSPTCGSVAANAVEILVTKEGFPIINDQAPLVAPCPAPYNPPSPPEQPEPPVVDPEPPIVTEPPATPPKPVKVKCNDGRGNGSEGSPDCDAGKSGDVNHGGD